MEIEYSKTAAKFISGQDKSTKRRIKSGVEGLLNTPAKGDIRPMKKYKDGRLRLRIGKLRVIYRHDLDNSKKVLYIIDIDNRGDIYK
jgi:mRNA interferase RelE/StbE